VGDIRQSPPYKEALLGLRSFMFERVYLGPVARADSAAAATMVEELFAHHLAGGDAQSATDWVAGMTDGYAQRAHAELRAAERSPA
jgi:dGTPase